MYNSQAMQCTMELAIFTLLLLSNIGNCQSFDAKNISKIICSLIRSSHVDIFKQELVDSIKLSKDLFQECNIRVRIVFDVSDNVLYTKYRTAEKLLKNSERNPQLSGFSGRNSSVEFLEHMTLSIRP